MKEFKLSLIFVLLSIYASFGQQRTITGTVTDEEGLALIGANVIIKNTSVGTVTDIDGAYSLEVPTGTEVLSISYTGYAAQEIEIGNRSVIDIVLSEGIILETAVVTALNIERQDRALGYSIEQISGDEVQQRAEPDVLRALQGKVAGVQISGSSGAPGSATRITIRGASSFLGSNEPLYVVDGIPFDNTQYNSSNQLSGGGAYGTPIATLDPNNIAGISVLKGAAAAALYGSRAANGVVLITTKTGSAQPSNRGLEVGLTTSYSLEQIAGLPEYQNTYGAGADFLFQNANGSWGPAFATLDNIPLWGPLAANFPELPATIPYQADPDNVESLFQDGHVYEVGLNLSTGNEQYRLSASMSHLDQEGYIPFSGFTRTSLNVGVNANLTNGFRIGGNLSYSRARTEGPFFGENGSASPEAASSFARTLWLNRAWDLSLPYELPGGGSVIHNGAAIDHPLWSWEHNGVKDQTDRIGGSFSIGYDVADWLSIDYRLGTNIYNTRRQQIWDLGSVGYSGTGAVSDDDIAFEELNSDLIITARTSITPDLQLKALVGNNVNQRTTDRQAILGTQILAPNIFDIDNTNSVVPNGGTFQKRRLVGVFGELEFSYKNFLFLTATGRNDWSSTLPTRNRSFFYPSVSASAVLNEALNIKSSVLTGLRVRASWAEVGNDANPYLLVNTFNINHGASTGLVGSLADISLPFVGQPGFTQSNVAGDPNLTPEFTREYEFGTLLEFFYGRVGLDITYYKRNSTDQIANVSLPSASGFEQFTTNFGDLQNEGIEIGLQLVPIQTKSGFKWDIYTAFTHNENEVIALADGIEMINLRNLFGGGIRPILKPGAPYGALFGTVAARDEAGNLLIDPNTGTFFPETDNNGFDIIGDPNPDFSVGITNTFQFKGVTLSAVIDYRHGGDIYSTTVERLLGRGVVADTEDREPSRIIPGVLGNPTTGEPILDESGNKIQNTIQVTTNDLFFQPGFGGYFINAPDEFSVYDGTNIRLREVSLGYAFPKTLLDKTPFGSASLTFVGRNLWRFAPNIPHSTNFDPERNGFGATNTQGIEYATAPQSKRYSLQLNVTF